MPVGRAPIGSPRVRDFILHGYPKTLVSLGKTSKSWILLLSKLFENHSKTMGIHVFSGYAKTYENARKRLVKPDRSSCYMWTRRGTSARMQKERVCAPHDCFYS